MSRRTIRLIVLAGLLAALAAAIWYGRRPGPSGPAGSTAVRRSGGSTAAADQSAPPLPAVSLGMLAASRREPPPPTRNPFRPGSQPAAAVRPAVVNPSRPLPGLTTPAGQAAPGGGAPAAAPPPPIPLRLIGLVEIGNGGPKVAVLSDGRDVYYGRDGEVVDGRYRIVRIGNDSVEMTYVDGRGRQTLRLPGAP